MPAKKLSKPQLIDYLVQRGFDVVTDDKLTATKPAGRRGRGTVKRTRAKEGTQARHIPRKPKERIGAYEQRVLEEFWAYYKRLRSPKKRRWTKKEALTVIRAMRKYHIYRDPHAVDWHISPEENILAFKYRK